MRIQWQSAIILAALITIVSLPSTHAAPPANSTSISTPTTTTTIVPTSSGCTPSNCATLCNPLCSSSEACIIGTMIKCGVCPQPTCVQRAVLGQSPTAANVTTLSDNGNKASNNSNNGNSNNGPLIGGLVGGLVGGALLFAGIGFAFLRHRRNQNRLGFAFQSPNLPRYDQSNEREPKPRVSQETVSTYTRAVPFSRADRLVIVHERIVPNAGETDTPGTDHNQQTEGQSQPQSQPQSPTPTDHRSRQGHPNQDRNSLYVQNEDFDDPYADDDDESRCSSVHSGQNIPIRMATMSQAAKIVYKKPQVMRVNTIKSIESNSQNSTNSPASSLQRSGSVRAILTKDRDHPTNDSSLARSKTMPLRPKKRMVSPTPNDKDMLSPPAHGSRSNNNTYAAKTFNRPLSAPLGATDDPFHDRHSIYSIQEAEDMPSRVASSISSYGTKKRTSYEPKLKDMNKYESTQSMGSEFGSDFPWPPMEMPSPTAEKANHYT